VARRVFFSVLELRARHTQNVSTQIQLAAAEPYGLGRCAPPGGTQTAQPTWSGVAAALSNP